ncbi:MAG: 2OG-Fe(II) oxygenase [Saprospiraceae bacterium]
MESYKQFGDEIALALGHKGYYYIDQFFMTEEINQLRGFAQDLFALGKFKSAGIGKDHSFQHHKEIRTDSIYWMDRESLPKDLIFFYQRFDAFVSEVNRSCYLGIVDSELHLAVYPKGTFYKKHLDVFQHTSARRLSFICYLNADWKPEDGGQLRLYPQPLDEEIYLDIEPIGGRMLCFLSGEIPHEVLVSQNERWSITGWLKGPSYW